MAWGSFSANGGVDRRVVQEIQYYHKPLKVMKKFLLSGAVRED
jgi:hypothetical protein